MGIILLLEATILPHPASSKLTWLAKIHSLNCWRQLGLPVRDRGTLIHLVELAGQTRWQYLVGEWQKGSRSSNSTVRAMTMARFLRKGLTVWDALQCVTRTCTAEQMKKGNSDSKYRPCWLNKEGHYLQQETGNQESWALLTLLLTACVTVSQALTALTVQPSQ